MGRIEILKKHIQECEEVYKRGDKKECAEKIEEIEEFYNKKFKVNAIYPIIYNKDLSSYYDFSNLPEENIKQLKVLIEKMKIYLAELEDEEKDKYKDEERRISSSSINSSSPQIIINNTNNNTQTMNLNINIEDVIKSLDNTDLDKKLKEIIEDKLRSLESLKDNKPKLKEKITNIFKFLFEKTTEASINELIPKLLPYLAKFFQ